MIGVIGLEIRIQSNSKIIGNQNDSKMIGNQNDSKKLEIKKIPK